MGFLTSIFGGETSIWTFGFALVFVIVLIIAGVWILKLLFNVSGSMVRGRQKRLAVIDNMALDNKHNLVLVRRDDVEHLLAVSSTGVSVIETSILTSSPDIHAKAKEAPPAPSEPKIPTPQENKASAERLGLTKILPLGAAAGQSANSQPIASPQAAPQAKNGDHAQGNTNSGNTNIEPINTPPVNSQNPNSPASRLHPLSEESTETTGPSLRHTGLLRPVSEMVSVPLLNKTGKTPDITPPSNDDSAMNEVEQIDAEAMESIEEGANPDDGKANTRKKGKKTEAE